MHAFKEQFRKESLMANRKQTNRRDFFENVSAGAAGMALAGIFSTLNASLMAGPQRPTYESFDMSNLANVVREPNVVEFKPWKSMHASITSPRGSVT